MIIFLVLWFGVGSILAPLAYGITFAHGQLAYPTIAEQNYYKDMGFAAVIGVGTFFVPTCFFVPFFMSGYCKYGLKFK